MTGIGTTAGRPAPTLCSVSLHTYSMLLYFFQTPQQPERRNHKGRQTCYCNIIGSNSLCCRRGAIVGGRQHIPSAAILSLCLASIVSGIRAPSFSINFESISPNTFL